MYDSEEDEIEKLKRQKLHEWIAEQEAKRDLQQQLADVQKKAELETLKKAIFLRYVTSDVRGRIANIRLANPKFANEIESYILALIQSGKIEEINFEVFKRIIEALKGRKRL